MKRFAIILLMFAMCFSFTTDAQAGDKSFRDIAEGLLQIQAINNDPDIPIMIVPSPIYYKKGLFGKRTGVAIQFSPVVKADYIIDRFPQPVQIQPVPQSATNFRFRFRR